MQNLVGQSNTLIDTAFVYNQSYMSTFVIYGGNSTASIFGNCTVEYSSLISQLITIVTPYSTSKNVSADFQNMLSPIMTLSSKFNRCGLNPTIQVQAFGSAQFVNAWQEIVTTCCYTCMFAYGIAGTLLAARMDKFKIWGFSLIETLSGCSIVIFSCLFGGLYAFLIAAIPSALITQMYASIPVRVDQSWATSLGVAQGIMIVYVG